MPSKKVKLFLGAFVNQTNAQNINCRELAKEINNNDFQIYTLKIRHGDTNVILPKHVKTFTCIYPVKITGFLGYLWGFYHSDIVYLPRADFLKWQMILIKVFKRKSIKTIENVIDDESLNSALSVPNRKLNDIVEYYTYCDKNHPITRFVGEQNLRNFHIPFDEPILPVPTDTEFFNKYFRVRRKLKSIAFIGNDFRRKGLTDFIKLANEFPDLEFLVIGRGNFDLFKEELKNKNCKYLGPLNHQELVREMNVADLHFFPSKSEGFGKVTIECAAMGIPSIVYDSYGAKEWINQGEGFVVNSFKEVIHVIENLKEGRSSIAEISRATKLLAERFSTKNIARIYERVFLNLYE